MKKNQGMNYDAREIPSQMLAQCQKWHDFMVEAAAEGSEELMDKYLNTGELTEEEIRAGLRSRTVRSEIVPVLCGSAFRNKGVQAMLDAVIYYLPSPSDVPAISGHLLDANETVVERRPSDSEPFLLLHLKLQLILMLEP